MIPTPFKQTVGDGACFITSLIPKPEDSVEEFNSVESINSQNESFNSHESFNSFFESNWSES
jgi:hypothetical protein